MSQMSIESLIKGSDKPILSKCEVLNLANEQFLQIDNMIQQQCSLLKILNLNHNQISKIENLESSKLPYLQQLYLGFNNLKNTLGCEGFINLEVLSFQNNQISNITRLGSLRNLTTLKLAYNRIQKVDGIENLKELRVLDLSNNQISKIDFIVYNKKLEELYLSKNQIKKITSSDFSNNPNMCILDVSYNQIENISFMNSLQELQNLNVSHNMIKQIDFQQANENLQILDLSSNKIEELGMIEYKYQNITHLYLQDNEIMAEYHMKFLNDMQNMIEINFLENPFYNIEFETKIIIECPWLEIVNNKEIGKPANYIIKEIKDIRQQMADLNIDVDQFTYSDLQDVDTDIITEEKFKAILREKGMESSDEQLTQKQGEKSELIFNDELQLNEFLQENFRFVTEIKQQYTDIFQKSKFDSDSDDKEILKEIEYEDQHFVNRQNQFEEQFQGQKEKQVLENKEKIMHQSFDQTTELIRYQFNPHEQSQTQMVVGKKNNDLKQNLIKRQIQIPRKTIQNSLPPAQFKQKPSILQDINQLKSQSINQGFQESIGIVKSRLSQQVQIKTKKQQPKMNNSSENFHNNSINNLAQDSGYKTLNSQSMRSSSIRTDQRIVSSNATNASLRSPSSTPNSVKLPQINSNKKK